MHGGSLPPERNCAPEGAQLFDRRAAEEVATEVLYKGFAICVSQRDRGLWVASIRGPGGSLYMNFAGLADNEAGALSDAQSTIDDLFQ